MKRARFSLGLLLLLTGITITLNSCDKVKDIIKGNIDPFNFSQQSFVVVLNPSDLQGDSIKTQVSRNNVDLQATINANLPSGITLKASDISQIKLNRITVAPESGFNAQNNFTNLANLAVLFNTNVGLSKQLFPVGLFAEVPNTQANETQPLVFDYTASNTNLKDYFNLSGNTEVIHGISGKVRRPITQQMQVRVTVEYTIVP